MKGNSVIIEGMVPMITGIDDKKLANRIYDSRNSYRIWQCLTMY